MPMTYIDILDSAVKIGLGAIIASVFALALSSKQHSAELQKLKIAREFEILKQVSEQAELFTQALLHFWASGMEFHLELSKAQPPSDHIENRFAESRHEFYMAFKELTSSESKLMLIGLTTACTEIHDYGSLADIFTKRVLNKELPMEEIEGQDWANKFKEKRDVVYQQLHESYKKLGI